MNKKQQIVKQAIESQIIDCDLTLIGFMDFDGLSRTVEQVYKAFPDNFSHTFAVKANPLVSVLSHLNKCGMGAEVASPGELKIALAAGYTSQNIIYDSPTKTKNDLRTCITNGIALNIDNLQELERIDQLMDEFPETESVIGFRINPQIGSGKISSTSTATAISKFGYALDDDNNRSLIIDIYKQRPWLTCLHTHTGSQGCSLELMAKGVTAITVLAEQINQVIGAQQIQRLDIGGGLPVNFSSQDVHPTFGDYAEALKSAAPILFSGKYKVKTEFGRSIVSKNGFILTRAEYTKSSGGRHIVATHAGAQVATRTTYLPKSWPLRVTAYSKQGQEIIATESNQLLTDISGPCCFAGDLIVVEQKLPKISVDDYVLIHDTGGYYFTSHFEYNSLPRVAVYAISESDDKLNLTCIRPADSLDDIVNQMSI